MLSNTTFLVAKKWLNQAKWQNKTTCANINNKYQHECYLYHSSMMSLGVGEQVYKQVVAWYGWVLVTTTASNSLVVLMMTKTLWLAQESSCCGVGLCLVFLCLDLGNLDIFVSIVIQLDVQVWWWFDDAKVLRKYKVGDDCLSLGLCGRKDPQAFKNDGCGSFGRNTLASCLIGNIKCVFVYLYC